MSYLNAGGSLLTRSYESKVCYICSWNHIVCAIFAYKLDRSSHNCHPLGMHQLMAGPNTPFPSDPTSHFCTLSQEHQHLLFPSPHMSSSQNKQRATDPVHRSKQRPTPSGNILLRWYLLPLQTLPTSYLSLRRMQRSWHQNPRQGGYWQWFTSRVIFKLAVAPPTVSSIHQLVTMAESNTQAFSCVWQMMPPLETSGYPHSTSNIADSGQTLPTPRALYGTSPKPSLPHTKPTTRFVPTQNSNFASKNPHTSIWQPITLRHTRNQNTFYFVHDNVLRVYGSHCLNHNQQPQKRGRANSSCLPWPFSRQHSHSGNYGYSLNSKRAATLSATSPTSAFLLWLGHWNGNPHELNSTSIRPVTGHPFFPVVVGQLHA